MEMTKEQIQKLEEGCENDFKFNIRNYINWKEKQLLKYIDIEGNNVLMAKIEYIKDKSGEIPTLSLSVWKRNDSGTLSNNCKIQHIPLGKPQKRKNFKLLKEYSNKITNDYIFKVHNKEITSKINILFSED